MDVEQRKRIVLLPIKPIYAEAIFRGVKKVEFRKQRFLKTGDIVLVYASAPCKKILGCFTVGDVSEASPLTLWRRYHQVGAISQSDYKAYFSQRTRACAYEIEAVVPFVRFLTLSELKKGIAVPQNFRCVEERDFERAYKRGIETDG